MFYRCANKPCYHCNAPENVKNGSSTWSGSCPLKPETCKACEHPDAWLKDRTAPMGTYRETRTFTTPLDIHSQTARGEFIFPPIEARED